MTAERKHVVYISHGREDAEVARTLTEGLEKKGIACWLAPRNITPGAQWSEEIKEAIGASRIVLLILSACSVGSQNVLREIEIANRNQLPILSFRLDRFEDSGSLSFFITNSPFVDADRENVASFIDRAADWIRLAVPELGSAGITEGAIPEAPLEDQSRGYVFISYVRRDADFVQKLRAVFESKRYGYWDYVVGDRDYHGSLYRELEERIDGAAAFMTIVSDDWRRSDWVASEFIYAREANIPIFVIQAKALSRPLPILLNLQTRIDMSVDFESGARTLADELSKKGL
ncbi:MAG: toll/interleukin-1 receptor domain-containing protein [Verrucomicrobiae bacterium]|nr:toll/interleukin-1 receptor domain-containing protein [Verrucomicrobiae bacterium]